MKQIEILLKALADRNRMRIIALLKNRKMCVCELAHVLGITQPSVSRHLRKLGAAGLISDEQASFWTDYRINNRDKCSEVLMSNINRWLSDEKLIKEDLKKAKNIDRRKLCCKKERR
ncbi:MAG: metalloregulator ArsR/SmtB family transcription factor [bacterium]